MGEPPNQYTSDSAATGKPVGPLDGLEGTVVAGRYHIVRRLGAGGMGVVYEAEQRPLKRRVALKLLRPALEPRLADEMLSRFMLEAEAMAKVSHPRLTAIYDFGAAEGTMFLAMELLEGRTLRDILRAEAPLPVDRVRQIGLQLTEALEAIHQAHMVHRDLKPGNIIVQQDGESMSLKLLDLGLVKMMEAEKSLTKSDVVLGSPRYMSPEQVMGKPVDHRTDFYALGGLLFYLLSGRPAFVRDTRYALLRAQVSDIPERVDTVASQHIPPSIVEIVDRCLQKNPGERPSSAADIRQAFLSSMAQARSTIRASERPPPKPRSAATVRALPNLDLGESSASAPLAKATLQAIPAADLPPTGELNYDDPTTGEPPKLAGPAAELGLDERPTIAMSSPPAGPVEQAESPPPWSTRPSPAPEGRADDYAPPRSGRKIRPAHVAFVLALFLVGMGAGAVVVMNRAEPPPVPAPTSRLTSPDTAGEESGDLAAAVDPRVPVLLTSEPDGARVVGPAGDLGDTPLRLPLAPNVQLRVVISAEGHEPREALLIGGIEAVHVELEPGSAEPVRRSAGRSGARDPSGTERAPTTEEPVMRADQRGSEIRDPWGE